MRFVSIYCLAIVLFPRSDVFLPVAFGLFPFASCFTCFSFIVLFLVFVICLLLLLVIDLFVIVSNGLLMDFCF